MKPATNCTPLTVLPPLKESPHLNCTPSAPSLFHDTARPRLPPKLEVVDRAYEELNVVMPRLIGQDKMTGEV